jgi:lactoylglutathione lyase
MLRVGELEKSIAFYTQLLGMKLLRSQEYPEGEYTLAFIGYQDEAESTVLELTYNWGKQHYDLGTAFGHIALATDDIYETCEALAGEGVNITRMPEPMKDDASHPYGIFGRPGRLQNRVDPAVVMAILCTD